jgi:antitoxin YefM
MPRLNVAQDIRPLSEFRSDAAGMIERLRESKSALILTQRGHSSAVVLDIGVYQDMLDELELLKDVHTAIAQVEAGQGIPQEEARRMVLARFGE